MGSLQLLSNGDWQPGGRLYSVPAGIEDVWLVSHTVESANCKDVNQKRLLEAHERCVATQTSR